MILLHAYQPETVERPRVASAPVRATFCAPTRAGKSYLRLRVAPEAQMCGKIGGVEIAVEVHKVTVDDAKTHAYGANQSHGPRPTNADKTKAVDGGLPAPRAGSAGSSSVWGWWRRPSWCGR